MSLKTKITVPAKSNRVDQRSAKKAREIKMRPVKRHHSSCDEDDSDCESGGKRQGKCLSRNAVIARMNRIKKKNYIASLEKDVAQYKSECNSMKGTMAMQTKTIQTLRNEVNYLKNVLANSKEISLLLKTVKDSTGLPTISSLKPVMKVEPQINSEALISHDVDLNSAALPIDDDDDCLLPNAGSDLDLSDLFGADGNSSRDLLSLSEMTCNVGVCLHVSQQRVSLEFCSLCNSKAAFAWESISA